MARRRSRLLQQARTQAAVQVSPERSALLELAREAGDTRDATVQAAKGATAGIKRSIHLARPQIHAIYEQAGKSQGEADAAILSDLSKLSGTADPFRAAFDRESAGAARRIASSHAAASKELQDRAVAAEEGRAFAVTNATGTYQSNLGKINRRLIDLAQEEGLSASAAYGKLEEATRERRVKVRGQDLTAQGKALDRELRSAESAETRRHNRATEQADADKKAKGKAYKRPEGVVTKQHELVRSVNNAASVVKQLRAKGVPFPKIRLVMQSSKTQKNPFGGHQDDVISAGIDLVGAGYLRPVNERALRQAGLFTVPRNWKRNRGRTNVRPPGPAGPGGV